MDLVRDSMTATAITAEYRLPVGDVVALLESRAISAVPIVRDDKLVGIVSTTDVVSRVSSGEADGGRLAADVMSKAVVTAKPDDPLDEAARRLVAARVHRLVVTEDDDRVVGVLSARDVLRVVKRRRVTEPIRAIMTAPVETVGVGDPIDFAIERLASANVHGLVVVDGLSPVGVFTHAEAIAARKLPPTLRGAPVEEVMSYETVCLDVETPIFRAAGYAAAMDVRRILVVERRHLVGILSCVDLVGVLARAPA